MKQEMILQTFIDSTYVYRLTAKLSFTELLLPWCPGLDFRPGNEEIIALYTWETPWTSKIIT
jgi:hypothetical protein